MNSYNNNSLLLVLLSIILLLSINILTVESQSIAIPLRPRAGVRDRGTVRSDRIRPIPIIPSNLESNSVSESESDSTAVRFFRVYSTDSRLPLRASNNQWLTAGVEESNGEAGLRQLIMQNLNQEHQQQQQQQQPLQQPHYDEPTIQQIPVQTSPVNNIRNIPPLMSALGSTRPGTEIHNQLQQSLIAAAADRRGPYSATANILIKGLSNLVAGQLIFNQESIDSPVIITGSITGLSPGLHGIHIHSFGDLSNTCLAAGLHFNPTLSLHGLPTDPITNRHVSDLGNIYADSTGTASVQLTDNIISLAGMNSILGRSIVIHSDPDDGGRGTAPDSPISGHSGGRVACGSIYAVAAIELKLSAAEVSKTIASTAGLSQSAISALRSMLAEMSGSATAARSQSIESESQDIEPVENSDTVNQSINNPKSKSNPKSMATASVDNDISSVLDTESLSNPTVRSKVCNCNPINKPKSESESDSD